MQKAQGHLIAILKNIWLKQPEKILARQTKFIPDQYIYHPCPPCVHWWCTDITDRKIHEFASILCDSFIDLDTQDISDVVRIVNDSLHQACGDCRIFELNKIIQPQAKTLFECRSIIDTRHFASSLMTMIESNINSAITTWASACVAPRIKMPTFSIPKHGLHVIATDDYPTWKKEIGSKFAINKWSPILYPEMNSLDPAFARLSYSNIFLSIAHGTVSRARMISMFKLRQLFSIILAASVDSTSNGLDKSGGKPCRIWVQFPLIDSKLPAHLTSSSSPLLPFFLNPHEFNSSIVSTVIHWYESVSVLPPEQSSRIDKCAYFINRAINSSDIEAYLNYYISLDALFGARSSVVESITNGVKLLSLPPKLFEKLDWLSKLRHELVHGGSRSIAEWPEYARYRSHFFSNPECDIQELALKALLQSAFLPGETFAQ